MFQRIHEHALLRFSGHDSGTSRAALEETVAIQKGDVSIVQLRVMAAKAAFRQDRRHARVEEHLIAVRLGNCSAGEQAQTERGAIHLALPPMPNWSPARTTFPLATTNSSCFSLCTGWPISS